MHEIFIKIHVWSSVIFTIVAITIVFLSLKGTLFKNNYTKKHLYLEYAYIGLLYLGLFLGIIMYFFVPSNGDLSKVPIEELQKKQSSDFWAIEHFSVMIFALLIAQIGRIFTSKAISSHQKFKYSLFYYGSATCVVLISMGFYLYYKMR